jgi:hypothetical protein
MGSATRIPRGIDDFNLYLASTAAYLVLGTPITNGLRLGFSEDEINRWIRFYTIWAPVYAKYADKKYGRTTAIKDDLRTKIDEVIDFDKEINFLDRIAVSLNVTVADLTVFNIKKGALEKTTRTVPTSRIDELVQAMLIPAGGGDVTIKCYSTTSARAAIYGDADCVQILYMVGTTPPTSAEDPNLIKDLSTRAIFTLPLGAASAAKTLYIYFRWYNTKHPELAGSWSGLQTTVIV